MIRLEPLAPGHAAALQELMEDAAIAETTPFPHPYPPDGARAYVEESMALRSAGTKYVFTVCDSGEQPIGMVLLRDVDLEKRVGELGYWIGRPYWGRGHATAAAVALLPFAFETLGLRELRAVCLESNAPSLQVLSKLGFVEVGRSQWSLSKWPEPRPTIVFGLLVESWRERVTTALGGSGASSAVSQGHTASGQ
jgi:RimJ/RimL family protein N-acetyltransferase